jgi:hypothetical protein
MDYLHPPEFHRCDTRNSVSRGQRERPSIAGEAHSLPRGVPERALCVAAYCNDLDYG